MKQIKFSQNWNKKLNCSAFTTIRRPQPGYFILGESYEVALQGVVVKVAKLIDIIEMPTDLLTETQCRLDTGYSRHETIEIFQKMYKEIPPRMFYLTFLTTRTNLTEFKINLLTEIEKLSAEIAGIGKANH